MTAGAGVAVVTAGAIALIYFRRGMFNNAAGVKAAAAAGTCDTEPYPVPTATLYTSVEPVAAGNAVTLLYWFGFVFVVAADTPASASLHKATTSPQSTLPPLALLFIRTFSTKALTWSSNLWMNA